MVMKTEKFVAFLTKNLPADSKSIPLSTSAAQDLLGLLSQGDYIYLAIATDSARYEVVKCTNVSGNLVLTRGIEGTTPQTHASGACVSGLSPLIVAVIKDVVCNYDCCATGECDCKPVAFASAALPQALKDAYWEGTVTFSGSTPMRMTVDNAPTWMSASMKQNVVTLYGTPDQTGENSVTVLASNLDGTNTVSKTLAVSVKDL